MNICLLSYWSCPQEKIGVLRAGGANVYILNFSNELGELGHCVDIFTPIHSDQHESLNLLNKNVKIIHLHKVTADKYLDAENFGRDVYTYIKKNSLKYDIIHSHYYYSGLSGLFLSKKIAIPHIITFHTLGIMKKRYADINDEKRIEVEKKIATQSQAMIASTELEERDLRNDYHASFRKIHVISPGVDHRVFKPYNEVISRKKLRLPQHRKIILFVGRIDPIKGINLLINAVFLLTKKYPEFEEKFRVLLIGGDITSRNFWGSKEVTRIRDLIGTNNLDCCVKFLGSRPHDILPYYYSAADLVVLPSFYESFGLVVLEAMSCGKTVVASKVGGLPYLIKDKINGRLFKTGSSESLSESLWEIINDEKERQILGKRAYQYSLHYSWKVQAKKLINVYKKLL